jgi:hypothetical protein
MPVKVYHRRVLKLVFYGFLGCVWQGSGSAKPTLKLLLHQFAAPSWS